MKSSSRRALQELATKNGGSLEEIEPKCHKDANILSSETLLKGLVALQAIL